MQYAFHYLSCWFTVNEDAFQKFKWIGNALTMIAATTVAVSAQWAQEAWPFMFYITGAFIWAYAGILMRDKALVALNVFFIAIDAYAFVIRL